MTDISKEAVAIDMGWLYGVADNDPKSPALIIAKRYAALQARVEELEAEAKRKLLQAIEEVSDAFERGCLQGLEEAINKIESVPSQKAWDDGCRLDPSGHPQRLRKTTRTRCNAMTRLPCCIPFCRRTTEEQSNAIEAFKGDTQ